MNRALPLALATLVTTPLAAHHGGGTWDRNKNVELSGTITGVDFINPHSCKEPTFVDYSSPASQRTAPAATR
jgi:hypothetical protein